MSVCVKYNNNLKFRRRVAFLRMYRSRNFKHGMHLEWIAAAVCALTSLILWISGSTAHALVYVFFLTTVFAVYFIVRLLRATVMALRVRPGDSDRRNREFVFDERGFTFGPVDSEGARIETRWRDIDKVYFSDGIVYILCMGRRHWAAVDLSLMIEGTAEELVALIRSNLPKRLIVG